MKRLGFALALSAVMLLIGCGQKGPLYLPEQTAKQTTPS